MAHTLPLTITDEQHEWLKKQKESNMGFNYMMIMRGLIQEKIDKEKRAKK